MTSCLTNSTHCLGLLPVLEGTQRCAKRDTCIRFTERYSEDGRTAQYLCPTLDDYYGAYVPINQGQAAAPSGE